MTSIRSMVVGTPLAMRRKKTATSGGVPTHQEELRSGIVTDGRGNQRFHGAFHGGFSAGYFNTVGSIKGFQPATFTSSRSDKAERKQFTPEDFMDDEDINDYTSAGGNLRAKSNFSTHNIISNSSTLTPGLDVVSVDRSIGMRLMLRMGWRRGQRIGTVNDDDDDDEYSETLQEPLNASDAVTVTRTSNDSVCGLGYVPALSSSLESNTFKTSNTRDTDRRIGLSALEDDDELDDVYGDAAAAAGNAKAAYDTSIAVDAQQTADGNVTGARKQSSHTHSHTHSHQCSDGSTCLHGFIHGGIIMERIMPNSSLVVPSSFVPIHRFSSEHMKFSSHLERFRVQITAVAGRQRKKLSADERAAALGETPLPSMPRAQRSIYELISEEDKIRLGAQLAGKFSVGAAVGIDGVKQDVCRAEDMIAEPHTPTDFDSAARLKMFGKLTREIEEWRPMHLLCKRFNVPNPYAGQPMMTPITTTSKMRFQDILASINIVMPAASVSATANLPLQEPIASVDNDAEDIEDEGEEGVVDEAERPSIDLFKAIFEDDDESDDDDDDDDDGNNEYSHKPVQNIVRKLNAVPISNTVIAQISRVVEAPKETSSHLATDLSASSIEARQKRRIERRALFTPSKSTESLHPIPNSNAAITPSSPPLPAQAISDAHKFLSTHVNRATCERKKTLKQSRSRSRERRERHRKSNKMKSIKKDDDEHRRRKQERHALKHENNERKIEKRKRRREKEKEKVVRKLAKKLRRREHKS